MARNLGEAFVQISPDLSGFGPELQAGVQSAMAKAVSEVEEANDEIEASFRATAQSAETALGQVDGDGFQKVRQSADAAGDAVASQLREGARVGDQALADVDGDQFREAKDEAKKAGDQIGDSLAEGAKKGDNALQNLAKSAGFAALTAGLVKFAKNSVDAFADLGETVSKATVIFGENVDQIVRYGDEASQALGQSKQAAIAAASDFAIFGNAAGLTGRDLASFSTELTTLASDLASFSNTTPEDAVLALGAALRGESEPIRRYGVLLNDASLKARALEMGIYDGNGALSAQQRVLAANAEIFAQTTLAQGDFERTSGSLANQQKILAAEFADLQVTIGQALAPAFSTLVSIAGAALDAFSALPGAVQSFIAVGAIGVAAFASLSKAIQGMGVAASTANIYIAGLTAALVVGVAIFSAFTRESKQAAERQSKLNDALVEAGDPAATLAQRVKELVTQYQNMNPATEEASEGVEGLEGALAFTQTQLGKYTNALLETGVTVEDITSAVQGGTDSFQALEREVKRATAGGVSFAQAYDEIAEAIDKTLGASHPLADSLKEIASSGKLTRNEFVSLIDGLDETADAFDDQREANEKANKALFDNEQVVLGFSQILGDNLYNSILATSLATAEAEGRTDAYTFALENIEEKILEVTEEERRRWEEMDQAARAAEDVARAQETYNEELDVAKERLDAAEEALQGVIDAQFDLIDATLGAINSEINYANQVDRTIQALEDYQDTEDDLTTTIDEKDAALRDATSQILRQAEASVQAAIDSGKLTEAQIVAGDAQRLMADELRNVADLLGPNDPLRANLLAYADELEQGIPDRVETEIVAEVTGAREDLYGLVDDAGKAGLDTGVNFGDGVAEGIQRAQARMDSSIRVAIDGIRQHARDVAIISSPSELFAQDVGEPIADGIAAGIQNGEYLVITAMDGLTTYVLDQATGTIYELNDLLAEAIRTAESAFSETLDLIQGRRGQEAAARRVEDAEERVADAQDKVTEALEKSGEGSKEYESAVRRLEDAQLALEEANYRYLDTQYELIEQGPEGVAAFEDLARAAGLELDEIQGLVQAYQDLAQARKDEAKAREEASKRGGGTDTRPGGGSTGAQPVTDLEDGLILGFPKETWDNIDWAGLGNMMGLADGAIVRDKTYAMIGEAGPEAVIPISRPGRALELMAESGLLSLAQTSGAGGPAVQIQNATFANATDADLVAQRVNAAYRARTLIS
jgi:uncharacterized membrane-anchored protein YhcB (DUF1043 family)